MIKDKLRIVVLGYIVRGPLGGLAWHHLQYVLGLTRLGHDVRFLEDSDDYPSCYDPERNTVDADPIYGLKFIATAFDKLGLSSLWVYHDAHAQQWIGPAANSIKDFCASADLVLNLSGVNPLRSWLTGIPVRVFIDTDPAFTQIRHLTDEKAGALAHQHNRFFTFGENFGSDDCAIPDDGLPWNGTRQPVVLDAWQATPGVEEGKFTTVMQWDSYRAREFGGSFYGMKSDSFQGYFDLANLTKDRFEIALGSESAPREFLREKGWQVRDPFEPTRNPWRYQDYIRGSKAEFSVAKHGYVMSRSGWFSERSAAYLASGRPVVTQDTGFTRWLPEGAGLIAFSNLEEALAGIENVSSRYEFHCRAAREIASEYFDSDKVIKQLLERASGREYD